MNDDFIFRIVTEAQESEDDFIFTTIQPFCENVIKRKISKAELVKLLSQPVAAPRWIPVSERLPREPFGCIVSYHGFMLTPHGEREYDAIYPELLGYDGSGWNNSEGECVDNMIDVTAWMPLPEPWEGEKNE